MTFNVIDKYRPAIVVQQIEADYIFRDTSGRTMFFKAMPWYRVDKLVGIVQGTEYLVGAAPKTADVKELERMIKL